MRKPGMVPSRRGASASGVSGAKKSPTQKQHAKGPFRVFTSASFSKNSRKWPPTLPATRIFGALIERAG